MREWWEWSREEKITLSRKSTLSRSLLGAWEPQFSWDCETCMNIYSQRTGSWAFIHWFRSPPFKGSPLSCSVLCISELSSCMADLTPTALEKAWNLEMGCCLCASEFMWSCPLQAQLKSEVGWGMWGKTTKPIIQLVNELYRKHFKECLYPTDVKIIFGTRALVFEVIDPEEQDLFERISCGIYLLFERGLVSHLLWCNMNQNWKVEEIYIFLINRFYF